MGRLWKTGPAAIAAESLEHALNSIDTGILGLDPEFRPAFANTRFFEIWRTRPDDAGSPVTVDDLLARGGTASGSSADEDAWIAFAADHAQALRLDDIPAEPLRFPDGSIVLCGRARRPAGGLSISYTDITAAVRREVDEAIDQLDAEARFRNEVLENHAADLAALAETADESTRRVEVARRELEREIAERRELEAKLRELATTDGLTGILNRAAWLAGCQEEMDRIRETGRGLALLMIDVVHFKSINDRYGHPGGDAALRQLAVTLRAEIRRGDVLGRLGGEEFAIALPGASPEESEVIAERLVERVASSPAAFDGRLIYMTVSIGLAIASRRETTVDQVLGRADIALYRAKGSGRNRAVIDRRADAA